MSSKMTHLQMDAKPTPGSGIKLFGMVISAPPLSTADSALPLAYVTHQAEDVSSCVSRSGNVKEEVLVKSQQLSPAENSVFESGLDEMGSSSSSNTGSLTETPSAKSNTSHARDYFRRSKEDDFLHSAEKDGEEDLDMELLKKKMPKKLDNPLPCPRCDSLQTKFCYFNNYNVNQPRHFCKQCQRYWTAGGTLRNVPIGAGRRKHKQAIQMIDQGAVDDVIARENAADAAQQLLLHSFGKASSVQGLNSYPDTQFSLPVKSEKLDFIKDETISPIGRIHFDLFGSSPAYEKSCLSGGDEHIKLQISTERCRKFFDTPEDVLDCEKEGENLKTNSSCGQSIVVGPLLPLLSSQAINHTSRKISVAAGFFAASPPSDHASVSCLEAGQMQKAFSDCDEAFSDEKMLPAAELATGPRIRAQCESPRSGLSYSLPRTAATTLDNEGFNAAWGSAAAAMFTATFAATQTHYDSPKSTSLGKHPRDTQPEEAIWAPKCVKLQDPGVAAAHNLLLNSFSAGNKPVFIASGNIFKAFQPKIQGKDAACV
ncbi:hypothetical protein O6H91_17G052000 [Diphasiastrum complanatum]|uniref:Uncharacterized protein n=1 Tax=Diphasiastrum complanatum TaxID=34168 RepID=A0ACC2B6X7_DIPCM|nr:hypothetical protein O6H91_17G052000 [Diphasiastrum complanatum]